MVAKTLYWIPRILTILAILFMMVFSFDVFDGNEGLGQMLLAFLIHNVPAFILTGILIIAWKWEILGGVLLIAGFIASSIFFKSFTGNPWSLVVISPFLVAGGLFILHRVLYNEKGDFKGQN